MANFGRAITAGRCTKTAADILQSNGFREKPEGYFARVPGSLFWRQKWHRLFFPLS
jgi:hypothetical protein